MNIATLINKVNAKGIKLWQKDGQLRFKAPKGVWTDEIREEVLANKEAIILFLSKISKTNKIPPIQPAARTDENGHPLELFPLSFVQEPLWFVEQIESDTAGYNLPKAVTISGEIDAAQLELVINLIIARHENLRTIFPCHGSKPKQVVLNKLDFKLERIDLSNHRSNKTRHQKAKQLCQAEAAVPFDLSEGPLIRGKLLKLEAHEHVLMLTMHHIITDAWSMGVFIKEFGSIMDCLRKGESPRLPELPIQYLDFSVWQRKIFDTEGLLERDLSYWKEKLEGVPDTLDLVTDYPRPSVKSFAGARYDFSLDEELTQQLKELAESQGSTLFMTLLAAVNVLLYRYSGQEDICVGSPIANRQHHGTEGLIGMFINTLALRNQIDGEESFLSLMPKVKSTCLEAFEHQNAPFDKVVEAVNPQRSLAIDPIFQVMVVLQNTPREVPEHFIQRYPLEGEVSKFDLDIEFMETSQGLEASIDYRVSLYKHQTIERMAEHFKILCRAIIATPDEKINNLEFVDAKERQLLLVQYNNTQVEFPKDKCIHELFVDQVALHPRKTALVFEDEVLSYQDLYERSLELAVYLQTLGVRPDSLVGVCVGRSVDMLVGILGILQAGGAYVPLDPDYPDDRLAYMLEDSQATIVLTQEALEGKLRKLPTQNVQLIAIDRQWSEISSIVAGQKAKLHEVVKPHNLAYMIYTSGSTGEPKGVMVEHRSLVNHNIYARQKYQITQDDKQLLFSSMNFDLFVEEVFVVLNSGAQLVIEQKEKLLTLQYFESLIEIHNITVLNVPTAFFHQLVVSDVPMNSIKNVIIGGEKMEHSKALAFTTQFPRINLYNTYGPTEATIISTVLCVTKELTQQSNAALIGRPISNTQIYILDPYNRPVPAGLSGELHIAGDCLARGYHNRPELNAKKYVPNPFIPGTLMYKSGDLARWKYDGNIEYLGRIDTQVKIRGYRIELGEIEAQLNQHIEIKDSIVVVQDREGDRQLIAYYVANGTTEAQINSLPTEDLRISLQQSLPGYMLPVAYVSLEAIPLTPNGKVDRRALERMDVTLQSSRAYFAPDSVIEKQLVAIWAEVLNLEPEKIGVNDNFFELGGDSIKTIQIVSKAIEHHINFDIRDMFKHQNIRELLQHCDTTKTKEIAREEGILQGAVSLSPIQSYFFEHVKTDRHHFNQSVLLKLNEHLSTKDLHEIVEATVQHHDVLRIRFSNNADEWEQEYLDFAKDTPELLGIHSYNITGLNENEASNYIESTCNYWQGQLDLENGPIMRWVYFDSSSNGHDRLAIIIHHLVIDGVSWRILLEDLNQLIGQQIAQQRLQLSKKRSSYRNWVNSLRDYKESSQGQKELAFWLEQSESSKSFENAFAAKDYRNSDIQHSRVSLSKSQTEKLLKHCHQAYGTTVNELLLTAVMLSYFRATGNNRLMLDLEGHGREQLDPAIDITKTLGWFTSIYPVLFELSNPESIGQSIREIKTALDLIPNKGVGFSIFRYMDGVEAIKAMPEAQVVFNFLGDFQSDDRESTSKYLAFSEDSTGDTSSQNVEVDKLVTINGMVVFQQLTFTFSFPEEWQGQEVSHWKTHFISALERLIEHCHESPRLAYTVSDFPLLSASLTELDKIAFDLKKHQQYKLDDIQDIYPLSPLQSGILFETLYAQTEENSGMYLTQSAIGINGRVDVEALHQSWQLILNHFDALRMLVITADIASTKLGLQVIPRHVEAKINRINWLEKSHSELKSACEQHMAVSKRASISLDKTPLLRMSLLEGRDSCYLLFEQHHIVMDGWSQSIVLSSLLKLYQARVEQQDYQLPPTAPYGAYIETLLNRNEKKERIYWQEYLIHFEQRTPLPMSLQLAPDSQAKEVFKTKKYSLSKEDSKSLEQLAKTHRLTMNTVLQFVWGMLLHLHSGDKTITFGSVSSGRIGLSDIKYSDQIVGLCINTTPTCIQFDANIGLLDQLKLMQDRETEKLSYESTPLVEIQKILGSNTNEEFFQTLFVYENYPVEKISDANSLIRDFIGNEAPNYPLSVVGVSQENIGISFTYDCHFYDEDAIRVLMERFERIVMQFIEMPDQAVKDVGLVSEQEKRQLLIDYNTTETDYPKGICVHQLFNEQAAIHPEKVAAVFQGEELSYQQLYEKSRVLALYLQSLGVGPDSLVGLCFEKSLEMVVGMLGILQAGGAYVPLDPEYPDDRLAYMLKDSKASIVLTHEKLEDRLNSLLEQKTQLVSLDRQWSDIDYWVADLETRQIALQLDVKAHHAAYVIYTSGSTGKPKGVVVEHKNLHSLCVWHRNEFSIASTTRSTQVSNIGFDASVWEIWPYLVNSACLFIVEKEIYLDISRLNTFIKDNQITHSFLASPVAQELLQIDDLEHPHLEYLLIGGDKLSKYEDRNYAFAIINNYGPTESTVVATSAPIEGSFAVQTIGRPISNTQIYILNQYGNPVPTGVAGELHIAGDGLARGYLNQPELTKERFIPNPFSRGTRLYKSGDMARWLIDGNIEYLGRMDNQVKMRGNRIELGEIEVQLNLYLEIKDSIVIVQERDDSKRLIAFYVARGTKEEQIIDLSSDDLRAYLRQTLPEYMLPTVFVSLMTIPLTPNGKVDRAALQRMDVEMESSQAYLAPRSTTEKQLIAIWAEVLNLESEKIGVSDNFFELGGDSIKTIQVVSKAIEQRIHFDIRDMFKYQNIHELLQHCDTTKSRKITKETGILEGAVDLSPIQSYFFSHTQTAVHHFNQSILLQLDVHLSVESLQELIIALLTQHDALRMRYTNGASGWQQRYLGSVADTPELLGIHTFDISALNKKQASDHIEQTCNYWQAQLDLEEGPIVRWIYFDSQGNGCDQLAVLVHHLVIDGVSWRILLEDLNLLIGQHLGEQQLKLSAKKSSYRNWVDSLSSYKESSQGQEDLAFWIDQSKKARAASHPFVARAYQNRDIQHTSVSLSKTHTEKLLKHCHQAYGTDINDLLLTAVMLSYYKSSGSMRLLLDLEGHGREQISPAIDTTKTVGWFTSIYPVCLELSNPEDIGQCIKEIKTALHEIPNKGVGFPIFRYIDQHEVIKEAPEPQVVFNFLGDFQSSNRESNNQHFTFSESNLGDTSSRRKEVNRLVAINGLVASEQLSFTFSYPKEWQGQKITHWQAHFASALEALIEHCDASPRLAYTPTDFPLLSTSLTQLDSVIAGLKKNQNIDVEDIQDIYPLTPLQSGMLFETLYAQTENNKGMYLTQSAIGINGKADVEALRQAWEMILDHYDALRMFVASADVADINMGLQVIPKKVDVHINRFDWSEKEHPALKSACERWMSRSKLSGINLEEAPLMRISLFQGKESCFMLFEQHHIVMDGWSQSIVMGELFKTYQALVSQTKYDLLPSAPHKSYVEALLNRNQEEDISFWKKYLIDYDESTPLPMKSLLPAQKVAKEVFDTSTVFLSQESSLELEALLKKHRLTMSTALQFIWGLLLHLHSGNKTITFGSVSSGRAGMLDIKYSERIVGLCINTTPTCIRFDETLSLIDQLKLMQSRESEKLSFETTPLTQIQEILGSQSNEEFFQTLFVYENYPVEKVADSINLINDFIGDDAPNYPLSISAVSQDKISISFTYDGCFYNQETINSLTEQFERLTLQLIATPEKSLREVTLVSEQEKHQLLVDNNRTETDYPKDKCIHQLFVDQVSIHPENTAVVFQDEALSYEQLYDRSYELALYLQSLGVKKDDLIGLCMERSVETLVGMLGILQAGGAYVPLDPECPDERLSYMLHDSQVASVLTQEKFKQRLSSLAVGGTKLIALDEQNTKISDCVTTLKSQNVTLLQVVDPESLAYVIYTSGSTGKPKGVMVQHRSAVNTVSWFINNFNITEKSKLIQLTDCTFDPSVEDIFGSLATGATLHIPAAELLFDESQLVRYIREEEISGLNFVPGLLKGLLCEYDRIESIEFVISGGEKLDESVKNSVIEKGYNLYNNYGPTEAAIDVLSANCTEHPVVIGKPIANTQVYVLGANNRLVPVGVPGELHIAGDGLARGYLNSPELTDDKFVPNPFAPITVESGCQSVPAVMYRSGDLVRWVNTPDGQCAIEYLGRVDTQVKIRGFRIETGEIEAHLNQYFEIKDCAVVAQGREGDKQLIAYYVARGTRKDQIISLSNEDLRTHLQQVLPEYMLPAAFISLETIPLTLNGKVDRRALEHMEVSLESSKAYMAPRNYMEKQLVTIWSEVLSLKPEKIGVQDNFFELGGHSLLATQLVSRIRSQLKIDIPMKTLFNAKTLADVSDIAQIINMQQEKPSLEKGSSEIEFEETSL